MPSSPCTCGAFRAGSSSGRAAPRATGTSALPATSSTVRVLATTSSTVAFPPTQVTARRSRAGMPGGEQEGAGVVHAGVDIQDDGQGPSGHGPDPSGAAA